MAMSQDNLGKWEPECHFIRAKDDRSGGDNCSYEMCKAPVKSSPPTNQQPTFYRPDALPVAQPTVSKHWREKYHITWTCLPQAHLGVFQLCLWPLIAPGYLGRRLPCLSSALWCQYPTHMQETIEINHPVTWRPLNSTVSTFRPVAGNQTIMRRLTSA